MSKDRKEINICDNIVIMQTDCTTIMSFIPAINLDLKNSQSSSPKRGGK
jgi:hypothetical protein